MISGGEFRSAEGDGGHKAAQEVRRGLMRAVTEGVDFHILSEGFHAGQGIVILLTAFLCPAGDHVPERGEIFLQTPGEIGSRFFVRGCDNDRLNNAGIALGKQGADRIFHIGVRPRGGDDEAHGRPFSIGKPADGLSLFPAQILAPAGEIKNNCRSGNSGYQK